MFMSVVPFGFIRGVFISRGDQTLNDVQAVLVSVRAVTVE
jgi:hypothetical protein